MPEIKKQVNRLFAFLIAFFVLVLFLFFSPKIEWNRYSQWPPSVEGSSQGLAETEIVSTLDTPISEKKNVIWCASFVSAWKVLEKDVFKGSVVLDQATEEWKRLNEAEDPTEVLPEGSFAAAGIVADGIEDTIKEEMAKRFSDTPAPDFGNPPPEAILAYSCLQTRIGFPKPYFEGEDPSPFTDSAGVETPIHTFGIYQGHRFSFYGHRKQVEILFSEVDPESPLKPKSFAANLTGRNHPDQVIIAKIEKRRTLGEILEVFEKKIQEASSEYTPEFEPADRLIVPDIFFRIRHRFNELINAKVIEPFQFHGYPLAEAIQDIEFKLDRSGANLSSSARISYLSGPIEYALDGPFLILLKKRESSRPYFVMWVDNAELLRRWSG